MLQKNLSKISTHTHTYIYTSRENSSSTYSTILPTTPPRNRWRFTFKIPPHSNNIFSNVLKRPSDSTPPLLLYPLFTPSTFHRSPPLISPPIPSSVFVRAHTHGRHTHTYLSGQWMMEGGHERVVPSIPFDLATVIFFQIPPSSIPHPSSSIPIETKRKEGGGSRICVRYGNLERSERDRWKWYIKYHFERKITNLHYFISQNTSTYYISGERIIISDYNWIFHWSRILS